MKVVVSTVGKFHNFALARELLKTDSLEKIITGYPRFKLKNEKVPADKISSWPVFRLLDAGLARLGVYFLANNLIYLNAALVDFAAGRYLKRHPETQVYLAISSAGANSGQQARKLGMKYVCDRGSSHILFQKQIVMSEYEKFNIAYDGFDQRIIDRELKEYETADKITVPSEFAYRSFVEWGVSEDKLAKIPYGANLSNFYPCAPKSDEYFDVLYVGGLTLRKGIIYLVQAFDLLKHPKKRLTLIGSKSADFDQYKEFFPKCEIRYLGVIPNLELKSHMSAANVLVLPSIQEGLALVMAEAMACGCPVIGTHNTGAQDLFDDGVEGFIVPIRDQQAIADKLQIMADDAELTKQMSEAALRRIQSIGGWTQYGENMMALFKKLVG